MVRKSKSYEDDEAELYRLTNLLSKLSEKSKLTKKEIEALKKAALALSILFIHGYRKEIEAIYDHLDDELTPGQKHHLRSLGIKDNKHE